MQLGARGARLWLVDQTEAVIGGALLTGRHRRATDRAVGAA